MATTNESPVKQITDGARAIITRISQYLDPVLQPLKRAGGFIFSSFFRFMIVLGIVLMALGALSADGHVAGHLGVYGATSAGIGVLGRLIINWKLSQSG